MTTTYASDEDPRDNSLLAIRNAHRVPFPELGMDIIDRKRSPLNNVHIAVNCKQDIKIQPDRSLTQIYQTRNIIEHKKVVIAIDKKEILR